MKQKRFLGETMKGISLPINMIVIIALAVIVLLAVTAAFMGGFGPGTKTISHQQAWYIGCNMAKLRGCSTELFNTGSGKIITIPNYDPDGDGSDNNILDACSKAIGVNDTDECRQVCCELTTTT